MDLALLENGSPDLAEAGQLHQLAAALGRYKIPPTRMVRRFWPYRGAELKMAAAAGPDRASGADNARVHREAAG